MRRLRIIALCLAVSLLMLLSAGCGSGQKESGSGGEVGQEVKEIVIGYTGPLSGPAAEYGKDNLNGADMAINEINEAGGITVNGQKYLFRLEKLDDMADPTQAINNARRLRDQENAIAILNPVFNTIAPLLDINQEPGNEFLVMGYTSTPVATELGNELFIDTTVSYTQYVVAYSEMAWAEGWRKGAMVVTLGAYGDEWRKDFKEHWEAMGGEITADQPANYYTETDYSAQLTAALATNPDFLLIGGPSTSTGLVIEQARTLGFKGGFLIVEQAKPDYIADEVFNGSLDLLDNTIGVASVTGMLTDVAAAFNEKYTETYKMHNTWEAVLNYNGIQMLVKAIEKAGTVDDVRAIRKAFNEIEPLTTDKYPEICFGVTEQGRVKLPGSVQMIKDGKWSERISYVWWVDTEDEFNQIKEAMNVSHEIKWLKK